MADLIERKDAMELNQRMYNNCMSDVRYYYDLMRTYLAELPQQGANISGRNVVDLFQAIADAYDTVHDDEKARAYNRGVQKVEKIVTKFIKGDLK